MPRIVEITRMETSRENGTFGVLRIDKKMFAVTLEPPDHENASSISSIPTGQYIAKRRNSPAHGDTFTVQEVSSRSWINFHPGSLVSHTEGCILLGESVFKFRGNRALQNSGKTFKNFMLLMENEQSFHLTIAEAY